jgi:hypothetical protein
MFKSDLQHWVKDMRHSTSIKDEEGYPAFALVNKATGEAIKHSLGQSHPVCTYIHTYIFFIRKLIQSVSHMSKNQST